MSNETPTPATLQFSPLDIERLDLTEQLLRRWDEMMSTLGALPSQNLVLIESQLTSLERIRDLDSHRIDRLVAGFQAKADRLRQQIN